MPTIKELLESSAAIDVRIKQSADRKAEPEKPRKAPSLTPQLTSVYKITDGKRGVRASSSGLTMEEAKQYIHQHPENEYDIVSE